MNEQHETTADFASAFREHITFSGDHPAGMGGTQIKFRFPNGWGASVVRFYGSYGYNEGKWELAVLDSDGHLDYEHPVALGDVRGYLSDADVAALLAEIRDTAEVQP